MKSGVIYFKDGSLFTIWLGLDSLKPDLITICAEGKKIFGANQDLGMFNYKENTGRSILAKQSLEEIRLGSYINYNLNKTFAGYAGLHFSHFYNSNLNASPENKDYFGKGNKFIISLGILIH